MRCLVVGSSVVDLFSELDTPESASISSQTITFNLGDKVPIDINHQAFGGNGMNVSVSLNRLGHSVTFYTYLGTDSLSNNIENTLKEEGITPLIERSGLTSSMSFILDVHDDRVIFSHHPIKTHGFVPPSTSDFDCIFLSSIGAHWEEAYKQVLEFSSQSGIPIAFAPGSKQLDSPNETFFSALHQSTLLTINTEEARVIASYFGEKPHDIEALCTYMTKLGPSVISLTDSGNGAYAYTNNTLFHVPSFQENGKKEKTGAGDAYAAGFLSRYFETKTIDEAMLWGSVNAHMAMQEIGAQTGLPTKEVLLNTLEKNATFKAVQVN